MTGSEFFSIHKGSADKCGELQKLDESVQLAWEAEPVSPESPGPVQPGEALCRTLDQPLQIKNGVLDPAAFDDVASRGLSVNRLVHLSLDAAMAQARQRLDERNRVNALTPKPKDTRTLAGYAIFDATELRAEYHGAADGSQRRAFGIYDTADKSNESHADILVIAPGTHAKQARRSLRERMYQIGKGKVTLLPATTSD